jgi:hypothetical protein
MDKLIEIFEKSLAAHQELVGKKDDLVGTGEIIVAEFKKQRDSIVTLGRLLAESYERERRVHLTPLERDDRRFSANGHFIGY